MKEFELKPINQKSFYGKAIVQELDNGELHLLSYGTHVATIDKNGKVTILDWYSLTTTKHEKAFVAQFASGETEDYNTIKKRFK